MVFWRKSILTLNKKYYKVKKNDEIRTPEEASEILKTNNYKGSAKTIRKFI